MLQPGALTFLKSTWLFRCSPPPPLILIFIALAGQAGPENQEFVWLFIPTSRSIWWKKSKPKPRFFFTISTPKIWKFQPTLSKSLQIRPIKTAKKEGMTRERASNQKKRSGLRDHMVTSAIYSDNIASLSIIFSVSVMATLLRLLQFISVFQIVHSQEIYLFKWRQDSLTEMIWVIIETANLFFGLLRSLQNIFR